jgi:hypothetical protein
MMPKSIIYLFGIFGLWFLLGIYKRDTGKKDTGSWGGESTTKKYNGVEFGGSGGFFA